MSNPSSKPSNRYAASAEQPVLAGLSHTAREAARRIYPSIAPLEALAKSLGQEGPSTVGDAPGEQNLPFDFLAAMKFKVHNVHHSACIRAKTRALVGLGHVVEGEEDPMASPAPPIDPATGQPKPQPRKRKKISKVARVLDPLCRHSWQMTLNQLGEDYEQVGNAYLEVVREGRKIVGLHWLPAIDVRIVLEDNYGADIHYLVRGRPNGDVRLAAFGDLDDFLRRQKISGDGRRNAEVIHLPAPSSMHRWYGWPSWLASAALVELTQALHQHQFDFHVNRGVPEFILFLLKARADKKTWDRMTTTFDSFVGVGNQHKASIFNLPDPNMEVKVEKLAMEGIANGTFFRDMSETLSTLIVSAHSMPPSLAGILIPGKMGAANEMSNALVSFQTLEIGPEQEHFETLLGSTLGDAERAGLGLTREDFELRTIIEEMAKAMKLLKPADTLGRMRQELPEAASEGRDLSAGVKKGLELLGLTHAG